MDTECTSTFQKHLEIGNKRVNDTVESWNFKRCKKISQNISRSVSDPVMEPLGSPSEAILATLRTLFDEQISPLKTEILRIGKVVDKLTDEVQLLRSSVLEAGTEDSDSGTSTEDSDSGTGTEVLSTCSKNKADVESEENPSPIVYTKEYLLGRLSSWARLKKRLEKNFITERQIENTLTLAGLLNLPLNYKKNFLLFNEQLYEKGIGLIYKEFLKSIHLINGNPILTKEKQIDSTKDITVSSIVKYCLQGTFTDNVSNWASWTGDSPKPCMERRLSLQNSTACKIICDYVKEEINPEFNMNVLGSICQAHIKALNSPRSYFGANGHDDNALSIPAELTIRVQLNGDAEAANTAVHILPSSSELAAPFSENIDAKNVLFRKLPFYNVKHEILRPMFLIANNPSTLLFTGEEINATHEFHFSFLLSSAMLTDVLKTSRRNSTEGPERECNVYVQIRICTFDNNTIGSSASEHDDFLPLGLFVRMNGDSCELPAPSSVPESRRIPKPINITVPMRASIVYPNHLIINWLPESDKAFAITVNIVEELTLDCLINEFKDRPTIPTCVTRRIIAQQYEYATDFVRVSLVCPMGKFRMTCPAKGKHCTHLQCFDGMAYVTVNEKVPVWRCYVCDKALYFDDLFVDQYMLDILRSERLSSDCQMVTLLIDGTWRDYKEELLSNYELQNDYYGFASESRTDLSEAGEPPDSSTS